MERPDKVREELIKLMASLPSIKILTYSGYKEELVTKLIS